MMTSPTLENHLVFWQTLGGCFAQGKTVITALDEAKAALAGSAFEPVVMELAEAVNRGWTISKAMERRKDFFSRGVRTMQRAGEVGGVLDLAARRIEQCLRDGSLAIPGVARADVNEQVAYWRAFGVLMSSGVPILEALSIIAENASDTKLADATRAIQKSIAEGQCMSEPMRAFPDVFREEVCAAVEIGERTGELDTQALRIADALNAGKLDALAPVAAEKTPAAPHAEESVVVRYLNQVISQAVEAIASDIHFDPAEDGSGRVRMRVDGVLVDLEAPPRWVLPNIVSRIKILGKMDVTERRLPQDGRIVMTVSGERCDLRVSVVPVLWGERVVMRVLRSDAVQLDLKALGYVGEDLDKIRRLCHLPRGLVVCAGPTGSGCTTLLYAMLQEEDRDKGCVMTVENPVEYSFPGTAQIEINPGLGLTFARALRSVLRQAPNVIMIGEIRDLETLTLAVRAAVTGHLVLAGMAAPSSAGAIRLMLDMGIEPFLLNSALGGVISQRLVRTICPDCRERYEPAPHTLPPEFAGRVKEGTFYAGRGCNACRNLGYRGRVAVNEILVPDEHVRRAVIAAADVVGIHDAAMAGGMRSMIADGFEKATRGITTIEEVIWMVPLGPQDGTA